MSRNSRSSAYWATASWVDVSLDAEGEHYGLVPHHHRRLLSLGQLLPAVAAPRGEQLDEHRRANAIGERECHAIDIGDLQALPRRQSRGREDAGSDESSGLQCSATEGVDESGGALADAVVAAPAMSAAAATAVIGGRIGSTSRPGFVADGAADWSLTEIVAAPRSARRWSRTIRDRPHRPATPWRPRSLPAWCGATPVRRSRAV